MARIPPLPVLCRVMLLQVFVTNHKYFSQLYYYSHLKNLNPQLNILPKVTLHLEGKSGSKLLRGSSTHSKPSTHFPQSKFLSGLKQLPHTSPSCCVPRSKVKCNFQIIIIYLKYWLQLNVIFSHYIVLGYLFWIMKRIVFYWNGKYP